MKKLTMIILLTTMFLPVAALCKKGDPPPGPRDEMEMQMMELQMHERKAEMQHRQQMREIELAERSAALEDVRHEDDEDDDDDDENKGCQALLLLIFVIHILVAVWVYQDIRQRDKGSGLWIVIVLLAGLLGALVYAVTRIGDEPAKK